VLQAARVHALRRQGIPRRVLKRLLAPRLGKLSTIAHVESRRFGLFRCYIHGVREASDSKHWAKASMRRDNAFDSVNLVRAERRRWQENHLLAEGALNDLIAVCNEVEAFLVSNTGRGY
jgi:hypothetical protein